MLASAYVRGASACSQYVWSDRGGHWLRDKTDLSSNEDGDWVNKRNDATKASSVHPTQQQAVDAARQMLQNQGGGELTTQGRNGQIRSKDTIAPGNDPNPPRDREH